MRRHLPLPGIAFDYRWLGASRWNDSERHFLNPPRDFVAEFHRLCGTGCHDDLNIDIATKDCFAFNYHAEESDADWMIRATDDMVINFDLFPEYIRDLQMRYDPKKDVVVRGDCIHFNEWIYPQGGSGALFSRAASTLLARDHALMIGRWIESEDISLGVYMQAKGVNVSLMADAHFLGLGWKNLDHFDEVVSGTRERCPVPEPERTDCQRVFVSPLMDTVFYHAETDENGMDGHFQVTQRLFKANKTIMWYPGDNWAFPNLCLPRSHGWLFNLWAWITKAFARR
jgi:hypothetical protein